MPKIYKPGKVAVVLTGRHAGKKDSHLSSGQHGAEGRSLDLVASPLRTSVLFHRITISCSAKRLQPSQSNDPTYIRTFIDTVFCASNLQLGHTDNPLSQRVSPAVPASLMLVVVIKQFDDGSKEKAFPYIVAAGIERYPQKVTKRMGAKKIAKRSKVKPFVKVISYNHLMPTRYALELEGLKGAVSQETFKEPSQREEAKKQIKAIFEEKYTSGKNKWFFTPLRF
ncbi:60S ribosomal protein L27 [Moesziomyces antarcticus]|uniref:60S ribosomal protein L27 n=1 Tax=Pseudozyma antarctica TaxID=84753 RepID=UPI0007197126|nr:60S ribosomal protein L27 [Moesziomyces antarcticus]GAK63148.1 60S ribosomal protein L27 [Moesziomyces antarcticus]